MSVHFSGVNPYAATRFAGGDQKDGDDEAGSAPRDRFQILTEHLCTRPDETPVVLGDLTGLDRDLLEISTAPRGETADHVCLDPDDPEVARLLELIAERPRDEGSGNVITDKLLLHGSPGTRKTMMAKEFMVKGGGNADAD